MAPLDIAFDAVCVAAVALILALAVAVHDRKRPPEPVHVPRHAYTKPNADAEHVRPVDTVEFIEQLADWADRQGYREHLVHDGAADIRPH